MPGSHGGEKWRKQSLGLMVSEACLVGEQEPACNSRQSVLSPGRNWRRVGAVPGSWGLDRREAGGGCGRDECFETGLQGWLEL